MRFSLYSRLFLASCAMLVLGACGSPDSTDGGNEAAAATSCGHESISQNIDKLVHLLRKLGCAPDTLSSIAGEYHDILNHRASKKGSTIICRIINSCNDPALWQSEEKESLLYELVRRLIAEGFDATTVVNGETALMGTGSERLAALLTEHACGVTLDHAEQRLPQCHLVSVAEAMLAAGASANVALEQCVCDEVAELLQSKGAKVKDKRLSACQNAVATQILLDAGANPHEGHAHTARQTELLLRAGADPHKLPWRDTPAVLKVLLDSGMSIAPNDVALLGRTRRAECVQLLLQKCPELKDGQANGHTALYHAVCPEVGSAATPEEAALCLLDTRPAPLAGAGEVDSVCQEAFLREDYTLLRRLWEGKYITPDDILRNVNRAGNSPYFEQEYVRLVTDAVEAGGDISALSPSGQPILRRCRPCMREYLRSKGAKTMPLAQRSNKQKQYAVLCSTGPESLIPKLDYPYFLWLLEDGLEQKPELKKEVLALIANYEDTDLSDFQPFFDEYPDLQEILLQKEAKRYKGGDSAAYTRLADALLSGRIADAERRKEIIVNVCKHRNALPLLQELNEKDALFPRWQDSILSHVIFCKDNQDPRPTLRFLLESGACGTEALAAGDALLLLCLYRAADEQFRPCAELLLEHGADVAYTKRADSAIPLLEKELKTARAQALDTAPSIEKNLEWLKAQAAPPQQEQE